MTYAEAQRSIGKTATIIWTDNPYARGGIGRSGRIMHLVPSCEPTFAIDLNGDGTDPTHAFARNVLVEE